MTILSEFLRPKWSICYETRFKDRRFARAWAAYLGKDTFLEQTEKETVHWLKFWLEIDGDVIGQGGGLSRSVATLLCCENYRPIKYDIYMQGTSASISFSDELFRARMYEGTMLEGLDTSSDFLLASNHIPQLAIKLRLLAPMTVEGYAGSFFSPETLEVLPYSVISAGPEYCSSLNETIWFDQDGWIVNMTLSIKEFSVYRVDYPLPRWQMKPEQRLSSKDNATNFLPHSSSLIVQHEDVVITGGKEDIGGTLIRPSARMQPFAAALFIGGTGLHDRYGRAGRLELGYGELLERLGRYGLISLCFDKRGAGTTKFGQDILEYGFDDYMAEVKLAFEHLCSVVDYEEIPIFLIGHSLGGLVSLELASEHASRLNGVILLATGGRPIDEIVLDQLVRYSDDVGISDESARQQVQEQQEFFRYVRSTSEWTVDTVPPKIYAMRHTRKWLSEVMARNPSHLVEHLKCPLLILQGERDVQVTLADADLLHRAAISHGVRSKIFVLPGCDHLLKRVGKHEGIRAYFDRRRRLPSVLISEITGWMKTNLARIVNS